MIPPDPDDPLTGPFWRAANNGQLVMSWCDDCDQAVWYPRPACPVCQARLYWKLLGGHATLLSWTVVHRPVNPVFTTPYMPALVVPVEAPRARLVTRLVDCDGADLQCDMPLTVRFRELVTRQGERFMAPVFGPKR
ncbi:MAG TPA: OB-fold domain-containing protein [Spongiibacteraceae bacterium]|nr:OB-fold domain-containing protein [Spongiibacteraceae bacterium]